MKDLIIKMAEATDKGLVRERNEDSIRTFPEHGIAVLSDGMGGHLAGDTASSMAVDVISEELLSGDIRKGNHSYIHTEKDVVSSIRAANKSIRSKAKSDPRYHGMGATVVVVVISNETIVCHLGDSRVYKFVDSTLTQVTEDHTLAQRYLNEGIMDEKDARTWSGRNLLTKGLGIENEVEPDAMSEPTTSNSIFLLCSDGLTDIVSDEKILRMLKSGKNDLHRCANDLVDLAIAGGGHDNISVILVRAPDMDSNDG